MKHLSLAIILLAVLTACDANPPPIPEQCDDFRSVTVYYLSNGVGWKGPWNVMVCVIAEAPISPEQVRAQ